MRSILSLQQTTIAITHACMMMGFSMTKRCHLVQQRCTFFGAYENMYCIAKGFWR